MPSKFPRVRMAALATLATLSVGGVAVAATGGLAASAERARQATPATSGGGQSASARGQAVTLVHGKDAAGAADSSTGQPRDHATGPDASGPARQGLCTAWLAGQGDANGHRADAPAFQALAAAAGGADQVAAYCQADSATSSPHGRRPATPRGNGQGKPSPPVTTGPPASPGDGHGQGGPPTTA